MTEAPPLLDVRDLSVAYETAAGPLLAVREANFSVRPGETLGIVGESACGKSTTCHAIMGLTPPEARVSGRVLFDALDLLAAAERDLEMLRGRRIAMIFQDPMSSLNPVRTVGWQLSEALALHLGLSRDAARAEATRQLDRVGIPDAKRRLDEYPHQLSGGMSQRAMIAMALSCGPKLLIADEPTTALDVTVQAQILELLRELQRDTGMAAILVTHDLGVVAEAADRVLVMYAGRIVESATAAELFAAPAHPYTVGLLDSLPRLDGGSGRLRTIDGAVPELARLPAGCAFAPRCNRADAACSVAPPELHSRGRDDRRVACLRPADAA